MPVQDPVLKADILPYANSKGGVHAMMDHSKVKRQEIKMLNRKLLEISGVLNVESFDSEAFLLETEFGFLAIKGQNLHIKNLNLDQGLVAIEGLIHELAYLDSSSQGKSKGLLGKLFK
jgi:sporulation protein YabP